LANNSFDCCLSLWFIRFLKTSPQFIGDASLLTCATPSEFAGKSLIKLNPDEMNCSGGVQNTSWWSTGRIIGVIIACTLTIGIIVIIAILIRIRRHPSRSGYTEIDDNLYSNIDPSLSGGPPFPVLDEDYDALSTHTYVGGIRSVEQSEAPTHNTAEGLYAADGSQAGGDSQIQEAALIPHFH
jgi:hypothetical protein